MAILQGENQEDQYTAVLSAGTALVHSMGQPRRKPVGYLAPLPRGPSRFTSQDTKPAGGCARAPSAPKEAAAEKKGDRSLLCPAAPRGGLTATQTPFHGRLYREELEERLEKARH